MTDELNKGTVAEFQTDWLTGIIEPDDESEPVYFTQMVVRGEIDLSRGDRVAYELYTRPRKAKWAKDVIPLSE